MVALLIMVNIWNQIRCPSMGEWLNELDVPIPWNMAISKKEHSADTFNNLHKSSENYAKFKKKASPKGSRTAWFYVYNILKMTKLQK